PADRSGLKPNDQIISINNKKVYNFEDIRKIVVQHQDQLSFEILRNEQIIFFNIKPEILNPKDLETKSYKIGIIASNPILIKHDFISSIFQTYEKKFSSLNDEFYADFSPSDSIFSRGITHYIFKSELISQRASFIKKQINIYKAKSSNLFLEEQKEITDIALDVPNGVTVLYKQNFKLTNENISFKNPTLYILSGDTEIKSDNKQKPLLINGPLMIVQMEGALQIENVEFNHPETILVKNRNWTGAINAIGSEVVIDNLYIKNNSGEDALNIVSSNFVINALKIENSTSDAFDSDFSFGKITSLDCKFIGNDCLDVSESNIIATKVFVLSAKDKAISSGENSRLKIEDITIKNSGIGLVAKDGSILEVKQSIFHDVDLAMAIFKKKPSYSDPFLTLDHAQSNDEMNGLFNSAKNFEVPSNINVRILNS
ncbi:MAG: PDZ domain-containing protein, partial [Gammaproteobacteria bacterium]